LKEDILKKIVSKGDNRKKHIKEKKIYGNYINSIQKQLEKHQNTQLIEQYIASFKMMKKEFDSIETF
jgi:hypothetical protein